MQLFLIALAFPVLGGLIFGFNDVSLDGSILFIRSQLHLDDLNTESLLSSRLWSAMVAAVLVTWFVRKFGRKKVMIFASSAMLIGTAADFLLQDYAYIYVSGWFVGLGLGISDVVIMLYIMEMVPPKWKAKFLILYSAFIYVGILLSDSLDIIYAESGKWHIMLGAISFATLLQLVLLFFVPESKPWLLLKEQRDKQSVLSYFHGLFPASKHKIYFAFGILLSAITSAIGVDSLFGYAPIIFKEAGFSSDKLAVEGTTVIGVVQAVASFAAVPLVGFFKRRTLLVLGLALSVLGFVLLSLSFWLFAASSIFPWIVFGIIVFMGFAVTLTFLSVVWVVIPEIFASKSRTLGLALSTVAYSLFLALIGQFYLTLIDNLGASLTFVLFAAISLFSLIFIIFKVPETKNLGSDW